MAVVAKGRRMRAREVKMGDLLLSARDGRRLPVTQVKKLSGGEVCLLHGRTGSTSASPDAFVRVVRRKPRVDDQDAPELMHTSGGAER